MQMRNQPSLELKSIMSIFRATCPPAPPPAPPSESIMVVEESAFDQRYYVHLLSWAITALYAKWWQASGTDGHLGLRCGYVARGPAFRGEPAAAYRKQHFDSSS